MTNPRSLTWPLTWTDCESEIETWNRTWTGGSFEAKRESGAVIGEMRRQAVDSEILESSHFRADVEKVRC